MLRHMDKVHENTDSENMELSDAESDTGSEGSQQSEDDSFHDADSWQTIIDKTFAECQSQFEHQVKTYQEAYGVDEDVAREKVFRHMRPTYRKKMAEILTETALWLRNFLNDPVFISIKNTAGDLQDIEDYSGDESWKYAIKKRKFLLDKKLEEYYAPEINSATEQPAEQRGGGSVKPMPHPLGHTPVQIVENWVKSENERIRNAPKIGVINQR